jgi:hypothetical protein
MSIGYSFNNYSLKECCQLSQNVFKDVFHPSFIKRLKKKKVTNSSKKVWMGQAQNMCNELM